MTLKELFIDWLTESRYCRSLELRCAELRSDYTERLYEKDAVIKRLTAELVSVKHENQQLTQILIPRLANPEPQSYPLPEFDVNQLDWQSRLKLMDEQEPIEENDYVHS